jgi:hypothetical protein
MLQPHVPRGSHSVPCKQRLRRDAGCLSCAA